MQTVWWSNDVEYYYRSRFVLHIFPSYETDAEGRGQVQA